MALVSKTYAPAGTSAWSKVPAGADGLMPDAWPPAGRNSEKMSRRTRGDEEHPMMDILMLVLAAAFFALAIGYTYACERL
jgi:hypothetical protein